MGKAKVNGYMQVLFYTSDEAGSERLAKFIELVVPKKCITNVHSPEELLIRLHHALSDQTTIVICISTRDDLAHVVAMEELLCDFRTIIILPDRDRLSTAMAYTLRPRFIGYADDDYLDILSVISRMVERSFGAGCRS
jgi:hypothetical protein